MQIQVLRHADFSRHNIRKTLALLQNVINSCTFIAFDTEMGGLSLQEYVVCVQESETNTISSTTRSSYMDTMEERYAQHRMNVQQFPIVQFGFCCFTWLSETSQFAVECFEVPMFPRYDADRSVPDRRFMVQAKCLQYIRAHGFDLNEWIDHGVSFLSHAEQTTLKNNDTMQETDAKEPTDVFIDHATHRFLDEMTQKVKLSTKKIDRSMKTQSTEPLDATTVREFLQSPMGNAECNGLLAFVTEPLGFFRQQALKKHLEQLSTTVLVLNCDADNESNESSKPRSHQRRLRVVVAATSSLLQQIASEFQQLEQENADAHRLEDVGFTSVLDLILAAHKPIVGHNALLDWMQVHEKVHGPLPSASCAAFLSSLYDWTGPSTSLFDTKCLLLHAIDTVDAFGTHIEPHTRLEHAYEALSKSPFYGPEMQWRVSSDSSFHHRNEASGGAHQAGYDAFMTGFVFLRVASGLGVRNEAMATLGINLPNLLAGFRNQLQLSHFLPLSTTLSVQSYQDFALKMPSRASFVRLDMVRTPSRGLKTFHIQQRICWVLNLHDVRKIRVYWEGTRRVYVALPSAELAQTLLEIHQETKPSHGTTKHPMPSIGCVDISLCEEQSDHEKQDDALENNTKRQRTDQ